ncbi:NUDIX domain-containing protein [Candidatus Woesearchaeota archaeon]|nr:NUDIX domain-containing protein [Candidatus Woesearchaeota archaeon]
MYARRIAMFVLRDDNNRVLLQHRDKDASVLPDHWAFFGGGIEGNETPEEAVRREAKEELGIELKDLDFFKRYEFQEKKGLYEKFVFVAPLNYAMDTLKKQQDEGQDLRVFSFEELANLKISDNDKVVLEDLFNQ